MKYKSESQAYQAIRREIKGAVKTFQGFRDKSLREPANLSDVAYFDRQVKIYRDFLKETKVETHQKEV